MVPGINSQILDTVEKPGKCFAPVDKVLRESPEAGVYNQTI